MLKSKTIQFKNSLKFKVPAPIVLGAIILSAVLFVIAYDKYTSQMDVRLVKNFNVFEENIKVGKAEKAVIAVGVWAKYNLVY